MTFFAAASVHLLTYVKSCKISLTCEHKTTTVLYSRMFEDMSITAW